MYLAEDATHLVPFLSFCLTQLSWCFCSSPYHSHLLQHPPWNNIDSPVNIFLTGGKRFWILLKRVEFPEADDVGHWFLLCEHLLQWTINRYRWPLRSSPNVGLLFWSKNAIIIYHFQIFVCAIGFSTFVVLVIFVGFIGEIVFLASWTLSSALSVSILRGFIHCFLWLHW